MTLTCRGNHMEEDKSTWWWHNGTLLPSRAPSHFIMSARVNDSGEYRCQTNRSALSDPLRLQVVAGEQVMGRGSPITGDTAGQGRLGEHQKVTFWGIRAKMRGSEVPRTAGGHCVTPGAAGGGDCCPPSPRSSIRSGRPARWR